MTRGRDGSLRQVDDAADLTALLESLGTDVVELAAAPHGLGVAVGEPVIYDASERSAIAPGAVVLTLTGQTATEADDDAEERT